MTAIFTGNEVGNRGVCDSVSDKEIAGIHHMLWSEAQRTRLTRDSTPDQANWESREIDVSAGWSS